MAVSGTTGRVFFLPFAGLAQVTDIDMAKQHFIAGNGYYERGEYDRAIEEFQKSYELSKKADLHYNIAICYEKLVRVKDAVAAYKMYLSENPFATDQAKVLARIKFLEEQIAAPRPWRGGSWILRWQIHPRRNLPNKRLTLNPLLMLKRNQAQPKQSNPRS